MLSFCGGKYVLSVGANFGAYLVIGQSFLEGVEGSDEYLFDDAHVDVATVSVALLRGAQLDAVVEQSKDVVVYPVLIPKVEIQAVPAKTKSFIQLLVLFARLTIKFERWM